MNSPSATQDQEKIRAFVQVARRFCSFVEQPPPEQVTRLREARTLLAELVAAGSVLPQVDDPPEVAEEDSEQPSGWIGFGDQDVYWEVFDPYVDEDRVAGSLSDDFLDIYRDLDRGLRAYARGNWKGAAWEWRFHFDYHWGDHAVDALRALHRACRG